MALLAEIPSREVASFLVIGEYGGDERAVAVEHYAGEIEGYRLLDELLVDVADEGASYEVEAAYRVAQVGPAVQRGVDEGVAVSLEYLLEFVEEERVELLRYGVPAGKQEADVLVRADGRLPRLRGQVAAYDDRSLSRALLHEPVIDEHLEGTADRASVHIEFIGKGILGRKQASSLDRAV